MTAIVFNTRRGAVTEYDWTFQSVTPWHATGAAGLCTLGGAADGAVAITAEVRTGRSGGDTKLGVGAIYLAVKGSGAGVAIVEGETGEWEYPITVRASGLSRAEPGRGIDENYLAFGYRNVAGADFQLDAIEPTIVQSKKRRIG